MCIPYICSCTIYNSVLYTLKKVSGFLWPQEPILPLRDAIIPIETARPKETGHFCSHKAYILVLEIGLKWNKQVEYQEKCYRSSKIECHDGEGLRGWARGLSEELTPMVRQAGAARHLRGRSHDCGGLAGHEPGKRQQKGRVRWSLVTPLLDSLFEDCCRNVVFEKQLKKLDSGKRFTQPKISDI